MSRRGSIVGSDAESGSVLDYNFSTNVASIDKRSYVGSTRQPNDNGNTAGSVVNTSQVGSTTSSLEDYYNESIVTKLEERSFMFLLNLQTRQELGGRREYIKTLLIRLYFIWAALVIAIQPSYNFGEYGKWIARAINYPLTFGFEHLPYTAALIIAGIIFAILLIQVVILIIAYRSIYRMSKYWPKIKVITRILNITLTITGLPISWLMLGFLNCNYSSAVLLDSSTTAQQVLYRYPNVACYGSTNLAFIIIGLLSYLLIIFTTFVGFYTTTDANPRSETPFLTFDSHFYFLSVLSYQIYYLLINVVGDQFIVIQAVYFVVASSVMAIFFLFSMPFYRRWENAVYFGFVCATLGGSLCGVVSTYVNTQNEYGLGLGLVGMTVGVMIIFYFVGWLCLELWTRYINKDLRGIFMNHLERGLDNLSNDDIMNPKYILEKESIKILQEIEETNRSRRLYLFLKWCMKKGSTSTLGNLSDLELSKCFIKGVANQKTYQNVDLLIAASIICGNFFETGQQKSLAILEKAKKNQPSLLQRFTIVERTKEIETILDSGKGLLEIKHILQKVEKKQQIISSLHKSFFKEFINDNISFEKVESINKQITSITREVGITLKGLMSNYGNNKTVLRTYARFLEEVKFERDQAYEMYEEANYIEEEETKKTSVPKKIGRNNRVLPETNYFGEGFTNQAASVDVQKTSGARSAISHSYEDRIDEFSGIENIVGNQKKEYQFRVSLNRQHTHNIYLFFFLILSFLSMCIVSIGIGMSVSFAGHLSSNIKNSYYVCMPSAVPRLLLREIRLFQNFMIMYPSYKNELIASGLHDVVNVTDFFQDKMERMQLYKGLLDELKLAEASGSMSYESISDYTDPIYTLVTPVLYYSNDSTIPNDYIQSKNASISEITDSLIKYAKEYLKKDLSNFNSTISSGDFMYLWTNRNGGSSAFDSYCDLFLHRNSESVASMNIQFIAFYVTAVVVYGICAAIVVMILLVHLRSLRSSIKFIAGTLPKDQVGKIFQGLDKKSDEEMDIKENGVISKPQTSISLVVVSSIIVTVLCITMLFIDMQIISNSESLAIKHITSGVEIFRYVNRAAYRMIELFSFLRYPSKNGLNDARLLSQSELTAYHSQMKDLFGTVSASWEVLRYGGGFMKTYEDIDILISPITNCSNVSRFYCTNLDELITEINTDSLRLNEDIYYSNYAIDGLFLSLLKGSEMTNALMDRIINIFDLYSTYASAPDFTLSIVAVVIGYIALMSLSYFAYVLIRDFWDQIQQLRSLLNYLPVEYIDSNDALKQFVLFNDHSSKSRASSSEKSKEKDGGGDGKVRAILNSAVDGAVLCNSQGDIELFNPVAQKMFGMNNSDVLGEQLTKLFDPMDPNRQKLAQTIQQMVNATQSFGETLELECVRKNGSKFPSKVNLSVSVANKKIIISCFVKDFTPEKKQNMLLAEEKKKSEQLLLNIMPESVASRLKGGETFIAEKFNDVTVFFSDMVGFTRISSGMNPSELVLMLNAIVNGFDVLTEKYNLEKIKTIGDAYFCVGGINLNAQSDHPERSLRFAIDTLQVIKEYNSSENTNVNIRVGLHTGPVVAGVIGIKKFAYDLWGDTINTASRMESTGEPGRIQISRQTYERVHDMGMEFEERKIDVKGKGLCQTYLLKKKHHVDPLQYETDSHHSEEGVDEKTDTSLEVGKIANSKLNDDLVRQESEAGDHHEIDNYDNLENLYGIKPNKSVEGPNVRSSLAKKKLKAEDVNNQSLQALGFLSAHATPVDEKEEQVVVTPLSGPINQ